MNDLQQPQTTIMEPQFMSIEEHLEDEQEHVDQQEVLLAIKKQEIQDKASNFGQKLTSKIAGNKTVPAQYRGKFSPATLIGLISEWHPDSSELVVSFYFTRPSGGAFTYKLTPLQAEEFVQAWVEGNLQLELDTDGYTIK